MIPSEDCRSQALLLSVSWSLERFRLMSIMAILRQLAGFPPTLQKQPCSEVGNPLSGGGSRMNGTFQRRNRICRANTCPTIISRTINFVTLAAAALLVSVVAARSAQAQTFTVVHEFSGPPDGASPTAHL